MKQKNLYILHGFMGSPEDFSFVTDKKDLILPGHFGRKIVDWDLVAHQIWEQIGNEETPIHLVGYSMGGRLALRVFAEHPDRIDKLVLCSSQFRPPKDAETRLKTDLERARKLRDSPSSFLQWWSSLALFGPQLSVAWELAKERRAKRSVEETHEWAESLSRLSVSVQPDLSETLKDHADKITFVYGEYDSKYRDFALDYKNLGVNIVEIENAWHAIHLDNPQGFLEMLEA